MTENNLAITDRNINGDISRRSTARQEQKGVQEFLTAVDAVLAVPGVKAIKWSQYTPYFNDGDPCEFTTYLSGIVVEDRFLTEEEIEYGDFGDYGDGALSSYELFVRLKGWGEVNNDRELYFADENRRFERNGQDTEAIVKAFEALEKQWGAFDDVLSTNFGDPASVTATTKGFDVEYYEHD